MAAEAIHCISTGFGGAYPTRSQALNIGCTN
jgi:hypothetical protein